MERQIERTFCLYNAPPCRAKEEHQETAAYEASDCARFGQDLHIIVMRVIHEGSVVERVVSRKDVFQGAEPGPCHRMVKENSPGASKHLGAAGFVHFQLLVRFKSVESPAGAEPNH